TRQGALHETFNLAMLWKLPVVFCVENNGYAMGTSVARTANHTDIWKLGLGYEMPCKPVDAMKPEVVAKEIDEAIQRSDRGDGPIFMELHIYSYRGHSMSDVQQERTKEVVDKKQEEDPITHVLHQIYENKWATEAEIIKIDQRVKDLV